MAFNFPDAPTPGQIYTPADGPSYVWNPPVWDVHSSGTGGGTGTVEEAPDNGVLYGRQSLSWSPIDSADVSLDWSEITNKPATFPPTTHTHPQSGVTNLVTDLALKAPLASPGFTGVPTAPTASPGTSTTQLATTAFVAAAAMSGGSVGSLNDGSLFVNGRLIASINAGDLSIALVTWAGLNPSVDDPVLITFRKPDGTSVLRTITTPMSLVVPGAEGVTANVPFRLWVQMLDNAGALSLFVTNSSPANTITVVNDHIHPAIVSRVLGYMDWNVGLVTPGTWARLPNVIQMFGPGIKLPGDVVQSKSATNPGAVTHSGTTPVTVTGLLVTMTPTSPVNRFNCAAYGSVAVTSGTGGNNITWISIRRGGTIIGAETIAAFVNVPNVIVGSVCTIIGSDAPGVTSALTWDVRIRSQVAADSTWYAGGVLAVSEIMG